MAPALPAFLLALMGGCDTPPPTLPAAPAASVSTYGTYWRAADTLVVYDARPEVGVGVHVTTRQAFWQLRDLGVRFSRHTLYWGLAEGWMGDAYNESYLSRFAETVANAEAAGVKLLVVVHAGPNNATWANHEESYRGFARFMGDMAKRFPEVDHWQLWNEMDSPGWTHLFGLEAGLSSREQGRKYAEMLKLAHEAITRSNPDAWVVVGGSYVADFVRGIYDGGAKRYFDAMAVHAYGAGGRIVAHGEDVRRIMERAGDEGKPIWVTEFGAAAQTYNLAWGLPSAYDKEDGPTYDQYQLDWWKEAIESNLETRTYAKALGYQLFAPHSGAEAGCRGDNSLCWPDPKLPAGHTPGDYGFGLLREDGVTPRPSYNFLRSADYNRELEAQPSRRISISLPVRDRVPVGYEYERHLGGVEVFDVPVTRYGMTVLTFEAAPPLEDPLRPEDPTDPRILR